MMTPSLTKALQRVMFIFVLLSYTYCTSEAYYNVQREGENINMSFPQARGLYYHERLMLAGQVLRLKSRQDASTLGNVMVLFQRLERFHSKSKLEPPNILLKQGIQEWQDGSNEEEMVLDLMMTSLEGLAQTGAVTSRCVNDTGFLLVNMVARQGWALKFLDAVGKPGPGLSEFRLNLVGDYDLCRNQISNGSDTIFRGNYVTWRIAVGPYNPLNPVASVMIQWGVCMPDSCNQQENTLLAYEILQRLGLNGNLTVLPAEIHSDHREVTAATVAAIVILSILGTLMFAGTLYDVVVLQWPRWMEKWTKEEEKKKESIGNAGGVNDNAGLSPERNDDDEPLIIGTGIQQYPPVSTGKLVKALVAFSVYTNGSKVLNTDQQPGSISCLHGIRFISMTWVILGHIFSFTLNFIDNIATEGKILLGTWSFDAVANAYVAVDSFFTLSGLLVAYLTVGEMQKKGWRLKWGVFYFHRFWRLTPPYMLGIVLVLGLQQYFGQGPLWSSVQPFDKEFCEKYWWKNLLYVNNLVDITKGCFGHTWYLANDMQFFVISPLMIVPFYFNKFLGFASCGIFFLTHVITTGVLSAQHKWGTTAIGLTPNPNILSFFEDYYVTPWCRIGPYIVGIVTGYFLATQRDRIRLNWLKATAGWVLATAVALAVLYGLRGDIGGKHPSSVAVAALYNALARSAWGACVCWVIVACVAGWGGFVNTFLSWSPFVVLGRLTYMAYLFHISLIAIYLMNQQTLIRLTTLSISVMFMGVVVAVYGISFILMLALESPMIGLEKIFLPRRRRE